MKKNSPTYLKKISAILIVAFMAFPLLSMKISSASQIDRIPLKKIEKNGKNYKKGEVLVRYKDKGKLDQKLEKLNQGQERRDLAAIRKEIKGAKIAVVASENKKTEELLEDLRNDENIELVEPNYAREFAYVPNDSYFDPYQWPHRNTGQEIYGIAGTNDADADIVEAWDIEESGSGETIVAVIDSGVKHTHEDLANNMWDGTTCVDEYDLPIIGGCPNHGWDFEFDDNDPDDDEGHGTFVASIIGSETGNSSGIAGLSRYNKLKIMALRFDMWVDTEIEAIYFAKYNGAKVINASFTGSDYSEFEKAAIDDFGGIFVAASGNGGGDQVGDDNDALPQYPCNYTSENVICVAASDQNDALASFSNFGATSVDLAAPGTNVIGYSYDVSSGWTYYIGDGTSFAAPFVAGTAGLLYAHDNALTISQVRSHVLNNFDTKSTLFGKIATEGRLNIHKTLGAVLFPIDPTPIPIYRFWSPSYHAHFYTASEAEKNHVIATWPDIWNYERVAYNAYSNSDANLVPVYRFWSGEYRHHFYTASETEKNHVIATWPDIWKYERIAYYAYQTEQPNTTPVYRFWSPSYHGHFYTSSETEKNHVIATWPDIWNYERIAWYVPE